VAFSRGFLVSRILKVQNIGAHIIGITGSEASWPINNGCD